MSDETAEKVLSFDDIDNFDDTVRARMKLFKGVVELVSLDAPLMAEYMGQREDPVTEGKRNVMLAVYSMLTSEERVMEPGARIALVRARTDKLRKKNLDNLSALAKKALEINGLSVEAQTERKNG